MLYALPPLAAEPIFHIGQFAVTNTYINSTIALVLVLFVGLILRNKNAELPDKIQNFTESLLESLLSYVDRITRNREKSIKFFPIVGSLFFFILISNWMGLLPGIGSIGVWQEHHGALELVPLFRPANTDLNMTLAMAVLGVGFSHIAGVFTIGFFRYANRFIKLGDIWHAIKSGRPTAILTAFIEFFVGFIEIVSEAAKVVSLSLRLFGNIFAGEVLLTVIAGILAFVVPLPFMLLELLVGLIQAVVFSMLVLVYLAVATTEIAPAHAH